MLCLFLEIFVFVVRQPKLKSYEF